MERRDLPLDVERRLEEERSEPVVAERANGESGDVRPRNFCECDLYVKKIDLMIAFGGLYSDVVRASGEKF